MTCTRKGGNRRKKIGGSLWNTLSKHTINARNTLSNNTNNTINSLNNHTNNARKYMQKNYGYSQNNQNNETSRQNNGPKNVEITNDIKNDVTEYSLVTCVLNCIATSNKLAKGSNYINNTKNRTNNDTSPDVYGNITQTSKDRELLYRRALNSLSENRGSLANYTMMQAAYNTGNAGYKTGKYATYNTGKAAYNTGKSAYNTGYNTGKSVYDKGNTYYANRKNNGNGGTKRKRKY